MRDLLITDYIRDHLDEVVDVLDVINHLCRKEGSLELHRFFLRLQVEMGGEPRVLKQLLYGLGEEDGDKRSSSRTFTGSRRTEILKAALDPKNPELFETLEWLALEIESNALMWRTLDRVAPSVPAWRGVDFKSKEQKARNQRDRIESVRLEVAAEVFR